MELLRAPNGRAPANEIGIGAGAGGARFYIDEVALIETSEPRSLVLNGALEEDSGAAVDPDGWAVGTSAVAAWQLETTDPATTRNRVLPSTRPGGGRMLEIDTDRPGCGIEQQITDPGARVTVQAWIYVERGVIVIPAVPPPTQVEPDGLRSATTGRWQLLRATANLAAGTLRIAAATPGGAHFYIDSASAVPADDQDAAPNGNLLRNAGFEALTGENPGPNVGPQPGSPVGHGGATPAAGWWTWNNSSPDKTPTTTTTIVPSTLPGGGDRMIRIEATAPECGIGQSIFLNDQGPAHVVSSAWV